MGPEADLVTGIGEFFAGAGETLIETDYADACPIATVALEVSSSSEVLRRACADVFEAWIAGATARFAQGGMSEERARDLGDRNDLLARGRLRPLPRDAQHRAARSRRPGRGGRDARGARRLSCRPIARPLS